MCLSPFRPYDEPPLINSYNVFSSLDYTKIRQLTSESYQKEWEKWAVLIGLNSRMGVDLAIVDADMHSKRKAVLKQLVHLVAQNEN